MCELAKVNEDDIVMDPGCGDAIMIITAVRDYKAKKGFGNDLDPMKVLDQPKVRTHSFVMIDTDWRADITMARVAKHSQTTIQGLIWDFVLMECLEHVAGPAG